MYILRKHCISIVVPRKSSIALSMQRRLCVRLPFVSLGYETHINKRLCRLLSSMNPLNKWRRRNLEEKYVWYKKNSNFLYKISKQDVYWHIIINFEMRNIFFHMMKKLYIFVWHLRITSRTIEFHLINIKLSINWIKL